jgi:hypothetical protein
MSAVQRCVKPAVEARMNATQQVRARLSWAICVGWGFVRQWTYKSTGPIGPGLYAVTAPATRFPAGSREKSRSK